ncbi:methionyl-tRNA formyltransferase [Candidatus Riflebacteria bacterium]
MPLKIIFFGTPFYGLPTLKILHKSSEFDVLMVVTQPDPKLRRSIKKEHSAIKNFALKNGIELFQPVSLKKKATFETLQKLKPDFIVVAAYGKLLPKRVLNLPVYGCVNLHGSLLPKYRGAAPVQWSIIQGEKISGNTIMLMSEGMDEGDILNFEEIPISQQMTAGELYEILSEQGGPLMEKTLLDFSAGKITPLVQDHNFATLAPKIGKDLCKIDFRRSAKDIHNLVRGLFPSPLAETNFGKHRLKIVKTRVYTREILNEEKEKVFGSYLGTHAKQSILLQTGEGVLEIISLKPSGKKKISGVDFKNGFRLSAGDHFGDYFET